MATFVGCNIDLVGTYTLTATDGSLTQTVTNTVAVTVGAAAKLSFTTQPSPTGATGGVAFAQDAPPVPVPAEVRALDGCWRGAGAVMGKPVVILLSARAGEDATVDGLRAGADDYLTKPFSAKELVARVKTHLDLVVVDVEVADHDGVERARVARPEHRRDAGAAVDEHARAAGLDQVAAGRLARVGPGGAAAEAREGEHAAGRAAGAGTRGCPPAPVPPVPYRVMLTFLVS